MNPFALVHDTAILTLLGAWIGSTMWLYGDARSRLRPGRCPGLLAAAAVVVPFAVPLLYACLRPQESAIERREREAVRRLLADLQADGERCLSCRTPVEADYLRCPGCGDELRRPCEDCRTPLRAHWNACPYCAGEPQRAHPVRLVA